MIEAMLTHLMREPSVWPALALGACVLLGALCVVMAIRAHANTLRQLAQQAARDHAASMALCDANWRWVVQHIAVDALNESVEVIAFSGMVQGRTSELRFVLRDGRALVFATRRRITNCFGWGKPLHLRHHARAIGQLHAVWQYFGQSTGQGVPLPRHTRWFVMPLQPQQQRHLLRPPARNAPARRVQHIGGGYG
jgi:heme exporter protein D